MTTYLLDTTLQVSHKHLVLYLCLLRLGWISEKFFRVIFIIINLSEYIENLNIVSIQIFSSLVKIMRH